MSNETLFEQIAAPIPGDNPSGVDMRLDRSFHRIKDARNEASRIEKRAAEDLTDKDKPPKEKVTRSQSQALWNTVADLGRQALATRTKDLDIASYVIEAVTRTEGFAGLADTFRWMRLMVENCWDSIYPMPESEDGVEITLDEIINSRIQPLAGLSTLLIEPLSWIEITGLADPGPYCFWQYRQSIDFAKSSTDEKLILQDRGAVTPDMFDAAVKHTKDAEFKALLKAIRDCKTEYEALIDTVSLKIKSAETEQQHFISSSQLASELDECLATVRHITQGRFDEPSGSATETGSVGTTATDGPSTAGVDNALRTREDAFRTLLNIAEFFQKTEPQSLIPAQLKKIVRLGRLSPEEFFEEIVEDSSVREQLFKVHGLARKTEQT